MKKIFLLCLLCSVAFPRRSKLTFDPNQLEEQVLRWSLIRPTTDDDWVRVLGPRKAESYQVQEGDWLSSISQKLFKSQNYWPKIWALNSSFLTNPHEIEMGQVLALYREEQTRNTASTLRVIKLLPALENNVTDLDNASIVNIDLKNRHKIQYFVLGDEEFVGSIRGSYHPREYFYTGDEIYLSIREDVGAKVGETLAVVEEVPPLRDIAETGAPKVGRLLHVVGEVKVTEQGDLLYKGNVANAGSALKRGDKLIRVPLVIGRHPLVTPPIDLNARILMGESPDHRMFKTGDLVLLNKGEDDGMKPGFFFRVFDDTDPYTDKQDIEPEAKGEIQTVYVGRVASIGFVRRSRIPLGIGDTVVAAQAFKEPPFPPSKVITNIEMD